MIKGTKDYLDQLVESHVCPEHGPKLVVAWHAGEDSYVIRCGHGHFPEEVTRELSPTQEFKQGRREPVGKGLDLIPQVDLGNNQELVPAQLDALIEYAHRYGLDPYRGHVLVMYGKPYIGIDGYLYHANQEKVPYSLTSRPLSTTERAEYQIADGDHAWIASLNINRGEKLFNGVAVVTRHELEEEAKGRPGVKRYPVVAAHPWQLCQKRAEWQVLRRGFPIGESGEGTGK